MMTQQRYSVRRINLAPLAKFGCVLGGLAMFLPGLLCAVAGVQVIGVLRIFFEEWQAQQLELMGLPIEFDFIELLGLETIQRLLTQLDDQRLLVGLLIVLGSVIGGGLLIASTIMLLGWAYNLLAALTGGLEVELRQ
jgi:hypothetical protein